MYIVGIDRPYYPEIEYMDNKEEAIKMYDELLQKEHCKDGFHSAIVFMGEIIKETNIKTYY